MKDKETRDPSREQLAFLDFKTRDGESANETKKRMTECVNEKLNLDYKGTELNITSPCLLKLTYKNDELIDLEQII